MNPLHFTILPDEDRQVDLKKDFLDNFSPSAWRSRQYCRSRDTKCNVANVSK
jgi:hypothetical protein